VAVPRVVLHRSDGRDPNVTRLAVKRLAAGLWVLACAAATSANPPAPGTLAPTAPERFRLAPPEQEGAVVVRVRFELHDINEIDDEAETFEFAGVVVLEWQDPREAFDPAVAGVDEKIFQGDFQFDEVATGWWPQLVLVNQSGSLDSGGVLLRVQPDGTSTLIQALNGTAESKFDMRRFPFDEHRLEAIFEVLGFDRDEVVLEIVPGAEQPIPDDLRVPEWTITGASTSIRDREASYAGLRGVSSAFVLSIDARRQSFYVSRLVIIPHAVIVFLSFSVFWMDRSSLGDRLNVSFIGILTGVAYQTVVSDHMPRISYITLIHGFLNLSFFIMCATVVINLVVAKLDQRGMQSRGNRIDMCCRWAFPLVYGGLAVVIIAVSEIYF
jgi:hypothetical protein